MKWVPRMPHLQLSCSRRNGLQTGCSQALEGGVLTAVQHLQHAVAHIIHFTARTVGVNKAIDLRTVSAICYMSKLRLPLEAGAMIQDPKATHKAYPPGVGDGKADYDPCKPTHLSLWDVSSSTKRSRREMHFPASWLVMVAWCALTTWITSCPMERHSALLCCEAVRRPSAVDHLHQTHRCPCPCVD